MSPGQVDYVLLSRMPRPPQQGDVRLAWLNLNPIAVGSGRINRSRLYREHVILAFLRNCSLSKAHVRSNFWLDLHCLYAHLEVVRFTAMGSARPLYADAAKLCANCHEVRCPDINLPPNFARSEFTALRPPLFHRKKIEVTPTPTSYPRTKQSRT